MAAAIKLGLSDPSPPMSTHVDPSTNKVLIGNEVVADAICASSGNDTVVSLPARMPAKSKIAIELGPDPQLAVHDHTENIRRLLLDFQNEFKVNDRIWEIMQAGQATTVKVGRLLSLDLDSVFLGLILELLPADSRG